MVNTLIRLCNDNTDLSVVLNSIYKVKRLALYFIWWNWRNSISEMGRRIFVQLRRSYKAQM